MSDILRSDNDFAVIGRDFKIIDNSQSVSQRVTERLLSFSREWFLDDEGLPYLFDIFGKNVNLRTAYALILETISTTDGVSSVESLDIKINTDTRQFLIESNIKAFNNEGFLMSGALFVETPIVPEENRDILDLISNQMQDLGGNTMQDLL